MPRHKIANLQKLDHDLDLPHPWIRSTVKGTEKPSWYNPVDKTSFKFVPKAKWETSVRVETKINGRTDLVDEIQSRHPSLAEAWKAYNWIRGYKV